MAAPRSYDKTLIKKPFTKEAATSRNLEELAACIDDKTGYLYFARHFFNIQHSVKGKVQFDLFEYQEQLLRAYNDNRFVIAMLGRQMGKSTCAAAYLLWYAMFHKDKTILVAAHQWNGAQEIMQKIRYGYESCPDHIRAGVTNYNRGSIEFENGSRIISTTTTGNTGRGMSLSLLYLDEFAFVQPNIAEELWVSLSPTLSTGGKAIITSTPNSDEDQFATIWKESQIKHDEFGNSTGKETGANGFYGFKADWSHRPDRDEEWKKGELSKIGEARFRREHMCEFIIESETLIEGLKLAELDGVDPLFKTGQVRWYKKLEADSIYIAALDPCLGTGSDFAAIQVFELPSMCQVAEWYNNTTPIQQQIKILRDILRYIQTETGSSYANNIYWSVENNTVGESALIVINDMGEDTFPGLFLSEPLRPGLIKKYRKGFCTTYSTKLATCSRLKFLIEENRMTISSKALITELKNFIASGTSFKARSGQHDDLVSALLLAIRISVVLADWDPRVFESMKIISANNGINDDWEPPLPIYVSSYSSPLF